MRKIKLLGLPIAVLAGVCFVSSYALSQDHPSGKDHPTGKDHPGAHAKDAPAMPGMDDPMMKAWMEAAAPGPHHKALEPMAGNFNYSMKFRMDPSQEWMTTQGEYEGEMAMDGRFLLTTVHGTMAGPFVGMGALGYDNVLQKHVAGWIDNMGTGLMRSEGTCDGTCKTITFEGEMMDAMTKKMTPYRYQYEIKSNDEFTMRWWMPNPADGKMFEGMVITYKRAK